MESYRVPQRNAVSAKWSAVQRIAGIGSCTGVQYSRIVGTYIAMRERVPFIFARAWMALGSKWHSVANGTR